jgi:hypothetical protein
MKAYNPFVLPFTITPEQQKFIIQSAIDANMLIDYEIEVPGRENLVRKEANKKMIWEPHRFITQETKQSAIFGSKPTIDGDVLYDHCLNRFNRDIKWTWRNTPASQLIQQILSPLEGIVEFTRIFTLVRKPGESAPTHTDVAYGHSYKEGYVTYPEFTGNLQDHHDNNYAAIRIPLTEMAGNNGLPYLYMNEKPYYYNAGTNLYVIDEVRHAHGADPVDFHRGVVFVDGFVDFDKLEALKSGELQLVSERPINDWDGNMSSNFDIVFN